MKGNRLKHNFSNNKDFISDIIFGNPTYIVENNRTQLEDVVVSSQISRHLFRMEPNSDYGRLVKNQLIRELGENLYNNGFVDVIEYDDMVTDSYSITMRVKAKKTN